MSKVSDRVLHDALLHKLQFYAISGQVLGSILSFLSNRRLQVDLDGTFLQEYPVNVVVPQGSIPGPTFFLLYINDLPVDVISNIVLCANYAAFFSKCDQASDLRQQLELVSKLEPELRDTVNLARKWLRNSNAGKTHLVFFDQSNNDGVIDVKLNGSVLEKKTCCKMMGLYFFSKLDWGSYMISIAKTVSKEIRVLIRSMKFISPEVILYLYKYTMQHFIEYFCYIWVGSPMCYLYVVGKLHRRLCRTVGPTLAASLKPLGNCRNVASLILFYRYYFVGCSFDLTKPVPIPCSRRRSTRFSDRLHDFSVSVPRCYKIAYVLHS